MRAHLFLTDAEGARVVDLGKDSTAIGSDPAAAVRVASAEEPARHATLGWDAREVTWVLRPVRGAAVLVNGRPLTSVGAALEHQDVIELPGGATAHFHRRPGDPTFGDAPVTELPLDGRARLVFGRADTSLTRAGTTDRVELDPEDTRISKIHAVLEREGDGFMLADESKFGTELNGRAFGRTRLVFGDRFKIREYIFEFTGASVRRVDHSGLGRVSARGVSVVVPVRGQPTAILDDVSLEVRAGEFLGVLGGSGQGKSTLLNALAGVLPPTRGEVFLSGIPASDRRRLRAVGVGLVPQDDIVHRELTVQRAITYGARLRLGLPPAQTRDLVDRVIARLGLTEHRDKKVENLSGGQRKRVSIAIELLARPTVLFLDEPSSGLDPATEADLMSLLQTLRLTGLTVVCTTHMLQRAFLFDRIAFVQGGRLVFLGKADEAREHFLMRGSAGASVMLDNSPLDRIYGLLAQSAQAKPGEPGHKPAAEWEQEFRASRFARALAAPPEESTPPPPASSGGRLGWWHTVRVLCARQWQILRADRRNLLFLLLQAVGIGVLVGWVAEDAALRLFLAVVATLWFGCSNGAQQIVGELPIFRRERVSGLGVGAYVQSKLLLLTLLTFAQALLLLGTVFATAHAFHPEPFDSARFSSQLANRLLPPEALDAPADDADFTVAGDADAPPGATPRPTPAAIAPPSPALVALGTTLARWFYLSDNLLDSGPRKLRGTNDEEITDPATGRTVVDPGIPLRQVLASTLGLKLAALLAASLVGVSLGLAISALVRTPTQAVMWVPLVLIPQILLGGFVIRVPEMSTAVYRLSRAVPSFCVQRLMDVSNIYGQALPLMSNRTERPLFLNPRGEKKSVLWTEDGLEMSRDHEKVAFFNPSWQNLVTIHGLVGQTEEAREEDGAADGAGRTFSSHPRDTTKSRRDVLYDKGVVFRSWRPAQESLAALGAWVLACHGVTLAGLLRRQGQG